MKILKYLFAILSAAACCMCAEDGIGDAVPAPGASDRISLTFEVSDRAAVDIRTRVDEKIESDIENIHIFFFREDGSYLKDREISSSELTLTSSENYGRLYTTVLTRPDGVSPGDQVYLYAVGNPSTEIWSDLAGLQAAAEKGREEFLSIFYELSEIVLAPSGTSVTFTGMPGADGLVRINEDGTILTHVDLRRPYARIDFKFQSGRSGVSFKVASFDICNLPHVSALFPTGEQPGNDLRNFEDKNNLQLSTQSPNSFEFYMLENRQPFEGADAPATYHDRDRKDETGAFVYAPEYATYVKVSGEYRETDADGELKYAGDVTYTIHLGDFRSGQYANFDVVRNTWYSYTIIVNGVNNIIAEAKVNGEETESGAEGYIIDTQESAQIYSLDSHFEQVLIRIPMAKITASGGLTVRSTDDLNLRIRSPYTEETEGASPGVSDILYYDEIMGAIDADLAAGDTSYPNTTACLKLHKAMDLDWVHFWPQSDTDKLTFYAKTTDEGLCNSLELLRVLGAVAEQIEKEGKVEDSYAVPALPKAGASATAEHKVILTLDGDTYYANYTAFVDEYYYERHPVTLKEWSGEAHWSEFTNGNPRSIYLVSTPQISADGASVYSTVHYTITQKPIGTPFGTNDPDFNAFGFESVDESGTLAYDRTNISGRDALDGRKNMIAILAYGDAETAWGDWVDFTKAGYLSPRSDGVCRTAE